MKKPGDHEHPRHIDWDEYVAEPVAADRLGVGVSTMRKWRHEGLLPFHTVGTHVFFHPDDLTAFIAATRQTVR